MTLLSASFFLLPFTDLPYFKPIFREVSEEGAFYPLLVLILVIIFSYLTGLLKQIKWYDKKITLLFIVLIIYTFGNFLFNFGNIMSNSYMQKTGLARFVLQYAEFIFGILIIYSVVITLNTETKLIQIQDYIVTLVMISCYYCIFQYLAFSIDGIFREIYGAFGALIYHNPFHTFAEKRIHGFGQEPSHLGFYFSVFLPYAMFRFIRRKEIFKFILVVIVVILSTSRTLYVSFIIELALVLYLLRFKQINFFNILKFIPLLILFLFIISYTPLYELGITAFDIENNYSSFTRYVVIYGAILAWLDHNIFFGYGLGQTGFYSYPYIATFPQFSTELTDIVNHERWPFIHNFHVRILVELGIIGLVMWITILVTFISKIQSIIKIKNLELKQNVDFGHASIIAIFGLIVSLFSRENLTVMNLWIAIGLAFSYIVVNKGYLKTKKHSRYKRIPINRNID